MPPLDYGRSFLCNTPDFNSVRFWVESRTRIITKDGVSTDYYQCGSCKSENTFHEKDLLKEGNYDFLPIWGGGNWLVFRRTAGLNAEYRNIYEPEKLWGVPTLKLREVADAIVLESWADIRDATADAMPIVTQTELHDESTGLTAVIECPSKTMNISIDLEKYQVDTGPIAFPDLTQVYEQQIGCLRLAFIAFNAPHFADFVIEQPTPVDAEQPDGVQVHHYSKPFSLQAKNTLFALK